MSGGGSKPKERESQLALAQRAAYSLRRYGDVFVPLENQYMADIENMDSPRNYANVMGDATNQAQGVYEPEVALQQRSLQSRGLNPSSQGYQANSNALMQAQSRAMGQASADAALTQTDQKLQGQENIVKMGQGLQSESMAGQMDLAQNRVSRLRSQASADLTRRTSVGQGIGGAVGMAAGYGLNQMGFNQRGVIE